MERPKRKPLTRDLTKALELRPRDIFELYGIRPCMVHEYCTHADKERRLPSTLIPGRKGHRGIRLVNHAEFRSWFARWKVNFVASPVASPSPEPTQLLTAA